MIPDHAFCELVMVIVSREIYLWLESHNWMHYEDCFSRVIARTVLRFQVSSAWNLACTPSHPGIRLQKFQRFASHLLLPSVL